MPATITELLGSGRTVQGEGPDTNKEYLVLGTTDRSIAIAMAHATAPAMLDSLYKNQITAEPGDGPSAWLVSVGYGTIPKPMEGEASGDSVPPQWQFQMGGGSVQITQALSQSKYPAGAEDFHGAIGVQEDSNGDLMVNGMQIEGKAFEWTETHHISYANFTPTYLGILYARKSTVNDAPWRIWETGEVLFRGASGTAEGQNTVALTFSFAAMPNEDDMTIDTIPNIVKKGWQSYDVFYKTIEGVAALIKKPTAVYVNTVYESSDFSDLGLTNIWGG